TGVLQQSKNGRDTVPEQTVHQPVACLLFTIPVFRGKQRRFLLPYSRPFFTSSSENVIGKPAETFVFPKNCCWWIPQP
ncbi:hypothetical protein, partial [Paenibacillus forsythiae]|uniref:hypothetical protein n=1 Tax=Paenibacillus forsythiae TaxID=365616 RepID=UPI001E38B6C9